MGLEVNQPHGMTRLPSLSGNRLRAAWLAALAALLPMLLVALIGCYMRPKFDDFAVLAQVRQYNDGLGAALYYFDNWSGSFTRWFIVGSLAPLDWRVAALMPAIIVAAWFAAACWLVWEGMAWLGVHQSRAPLTLAVSALLVFASVHGFLSWRSMYWYVANTAYALPFAPATAYFALTLRFARTESRPPRALFAGGLFCILAAGMSEGFAVFLVVLLSLLLIALYSLANRRLRSAFAGMLLTGWLASVASFLWQLLSPGTANRSQDIAASQAVQPVRELPELLRRTIEDSLAQLITADTLAGFLLLLGVGCLLTLQLRAGRPPVETAPNRLGRGALWLGLLFQLLCLPPLFAYVSDQPVIFGRFSLRYAVFIALNLMAIASCLLLLWQRRRADQWLARQGLWLPRLAQTLLIFASTALVLEIALLGIYVWRYALVTVALACLPFVGRSGGRGAGLLLLCLAIALVCQASLVATLLFARGIVFQRVLTGGPHLVVMSGLIWGLWLGCWLQGMTRMSGAQRRNLGLALGLAIVAVALPMFSSQLSRLSDFQSYARQWDINHASILDQRERGVSPIVVEPMPASFGSYINDKYALQYYGAVVVVSDA